MADPITAIATWVSTTVGNAVATGLSYLGVSQTTAMAITSAVIKGTYVLATVATYAGIAALSRPPIPTGSSGNTPTQQTWASRQRVINRARLSGPYLLREAKKNYYAVMHAAQAPILRFDAHYLHDDLVTVDGAGKVIPPGPEPARYKGHGTWLLTRLGATTETSFNDGVTRNGETFDDLGAGVWTAAGHRGDGMATVALIATPVEQADFRRVYPNGIPNWSGVPVGAVYDWRKDSTRLDVNGDPFTGSHRIDDWTTWEESWNPVLWMAQNESGPPEAPDFVARFERRIGGQLAAWTQAADDCEDAITLNAGGTEDRYRIAGWYYDINHPADIRPRILAAFDGFTCEVGDGGLHIQAGVYRAPTFTLPHEHIVGYRWRRGRRGEQVSNELVITWYDPDRKWTVVPGAPWRDAADIATRGVASNAFPAEWVPSHTQARRLAKIAMARLLADGRGTIIADLYGLNLLFAAPTAGTVANRRWFTVQVRDEIDALTDVVVELVGSPRISLASLTVELDVVVADPAAYDWDETTEEGLAPDVGGDSPTIELGGAPFGMDLVTQFNFDNLVIA